MNLGTPEEDIHAVIVSRRVDRRRQLFFFYAQSLPTVASPTALGTVESEGPVVIPGASARPMSRGSAMLIPAARKSHTAAILEIATMIAALLSYIWGWQGAFAGASGLILVLYVGIGILSHARRGESACQLGLRVDNLPYALRNAAALVAPAVLVLLAIGIALDSLHFSWSQTAKNAPWLIAWGTAQQYGLLCFFYRRFLEIFGGPWLATICAATTFATFHAPNGFLIAITLAAGVAACTLYRRTPNVLAIGIAHAVISFMLVCALPYDVTHGLLVGPAYLALG